MLRDSYRHRALILWSDRTFGRSADGCVAEEPMFLGNDMRRLRRWTHATGHRESHGLV